MKKDKIAYWTATIIFVLFDSGGALFFNTDMARQGIAQFGYPQYFGVMLAIGKIIGGIILIIPAIPAWFKEWAYVGFGISLIAATVSIIAVTGWTAMALMPIVVLAILAVSYFKYHTLYTYKAVSAQK